MWNAVQCCVKCDVMRGGQYTAWSEIWRRVHGTSGVMWCICEMGYNARCGATVMRNVADTWGNINMVLQVGIVCCERCWCDMARNDGVVWNNVRDGVWCNVKCGGNIKPYFRHSIPYQSHTHFSIPPDHTSHGVIWDGVVQNLVWCGMFCNARSCAMLHLIHPNVAVMWNKVRCCAIGQLWNVVTRFGMMVWYMGNIVVCWCKMWNVVVEYRYETMVEMQRCGLECVPWGSAICNLYLNVMFMAECGMVCRDLMWLWFDVKCGVMWNVTEMRQKV